MDSCLWFKLFIWPLIKNRVLVISFFCRLNAVEYSDLKDKVQTPIRTARDVVIRQSLSDRFLEAFRQQVADNPVYHKPSEEVNI